MSIHDDHTWWSCIIIIYDDHIWWSYMSGRGRGRNLFDVVGGRHFCLKRCYFWKNRVCLKLHFKHTLKIRYFQRKVISLPKMSTSNYDKACGRGRGRSYMIIMYDHWSYMMIIYDDHIWWSYMMTIYDALIWSSCVAAALGPWPGSDRDGNPDWDWDRD